MSTNLGTKVLRFRSSSVQIHVEVGCPTVFGGEGLASGRGGAEGDVGGPQGFAIQEGGPCAVEKSSCDALTAVVYVRPYSGDAASGWEEKIFI